jgi:beta-galactosidase
MQSVIYGGDYNPEQWDFATWLEDMELMNQAGVNMVSLGVFAWSRLEPMSGQFDFLWLDQVMDLLHRNNIGVNLATATASPPPWMAEIDQGSLPVKADGTRLWHGSRQAYCPSSPTYRHAAQRLVTTLAERYKNHPALKMWHINNEYGCHTAECHCDNCAKKFQKWLQDQYQTLEALNAAWTTDFWGQRYSKWTQITPPRQAPYMQNPSQVLDWRRFCSDNLLECFLLESSILRAITPTIPQTTNFMGFFKPLDYWRWAKHIDVIANDIYPDPSDPKAYLFGAMNADLMRSLAKGKPWLIMEQVAGQVQWRKRNAQKRPEQMRLWSHQALARGASGIMFFQWRASRGGAERFHGSMLPHSGTKSRVWLEVKQLGQELMNSKPKTMQPAQVALVLDWNNWWALETAGHPGQHDFFSLLESWYEVLFNRNIHVNFVHPEDDLSLYQAVLLPNLHLVSNLAIVNLEQYTKAGGVVLVGAYSGIVDTNNRVLPSGYPGAFRKLLGIWIEEFDVLPANEHVLVQSEQHTFQAEFWADTIHLEGATALARFTSGLAAQKPCFTQFVFGEGQSFYLGTQLEPKGLMWVVGEVLKAARLNCACAEEGLEIVSQTQDSIWLNHNLYSVEYQNRRLEPYEILFVPQGVL